MPYSSAIRRSFTLIEMLVVVVIIIILASMLLPALEQARNAGFKAACAANLKQLQTAHGLYTLDNDKYFVDPDNGGARKWAGLADSEAAIRDGQLINYLRDTAVYYCEADETHLWRSYSINTTVGNDVTYVAGTPAVMKRNLVTESFSEVYTFIEESDPRSGTNQNSFYVRPSTYGLWTGGDWPAAYHISGYNAAFLDGHVKHVNMSPESVKISLSGIAGVGVFSITTANPDRARLYSWQDVK